MLSAMLKNLARISTCTPMDSPFRKGIRIHQAAGSEPAALNILDAHATMPGFPFGRAVAGRSVSIVTALINVLQAAVGLGPADAPAELPGQGMAVDRRQTGDQCAQQRHFPGREVRSGTLSGPQSRRHGSRLQSSSHRPWQLPGRQVIGCSVPLPAAVTSPAESTLATPASLTAPEYSRWPLSCGSRPANQSIILSTLYFGKHSPLFGKTKAPRDSRGTLDSHTIRIFGRHLCLVGGLTRSARTL